jgi:hypothetical protein
LTFVQAAREGENGKGEEEDEEEDKDDKEVNAAMGNLTLLFSQLFC